MYYNIKRKADLGKVGIIFAFLYVKGIGNMKGGCSFKHDRLQEAKDES